MNTQAKRHWITEFRAAVQRSGRICGSVWALDLTPAKNLMRKA